MINKQIILNTQKTVNIILISLMYNFIKYPSLPKWHLTSYKTMISSSLSYVIIPSLSQKRGVPVGRGEFYPLTFPTILSTTSSMVIAEVSITSAFSGTRKGAISRFLSSSSRRLISDKIPA
jgi:hypothetical protein